jgi:uncharacterized NAD(P)/FAD-binding protein YdhS
VVGGGAAGTLTAARLVDEAARQHRRLTVTVIEPRTALGRGIAYSTSDSRHLLNVPVRRMSAYAEDTMHFADWLEAHDGRPADPCDYAQRGRYGQYLAHVLEEAQRRTPWVEVTHLRDRVVDLGDEAGRCRLHLESGTSIDLDAVVLAIGHLGPELSWLPTRLAGASWLVEDPWSPQALDSSINADGDILMVGTGLTMIDSLRAMDRPGRVIHAISRHGIIPRRQQARELPDMEAPELPSTTPTLAELQSAMATHIAKAVARYGDWRPAVDSVRGITQRLWAGLTIAERADFVALDARRWEAARHRIPPASAAALDRIRAEGRLVVHTARVLDAVEESDGVRVTLSDGEQMTVSAVVNCAGPCQHPERSTDPLVRALVDRGYARVGPLGLGFDTAADGQLLNATGRAALPLWTLGSLRRGTLWETTAIPEIRDQAATVARSVLGRPPERDRRPTDRYGLTLSTTPEAAEHWSRALHTICMVQSGAERSLRDAVLADPGFAVGHAALALIGHEWGAPVDVEASLHAAVDSAQYRGDARERSFVQTVVSRLTAAPGAADRDLLRHVAEYPLDALAVSMAIPTIAFGGLAQPVAESWALADRLALSYGDDWWFAGMLAFVRQEQERWDDAQRLADRSMREAPASGHAAHALTHVYYETGEHLAGLHWIDRWIDDHADRTDYSAHYSWHAALHELALDDAVAVRRRYDEQLAPPRVTGPRALVDSASILWRSRLVGMWQGRLPIEEVLATVPSCLLDHPATAFAAMHAVIALAAAGDVDRIGRLRTFAATHPDPTYTEVIVPMCDGFTAHVGGEPAHAAEQLASIVRIAGRLGGSAAQQEVIAETMVHALVESGQHEAARRYLEQRLDRRPSAADRRRLTDLRS